MKNNTNPAGLIIRLMFKLLPAQILLAVVGAVNGIVSGFFATNYVGIEAMSAVGLYGPLNIFMQATGTMLVCGSVIICGKYMGQNRQDRLHGSFTLTIAMAVIVSLVFALLFVILGLLDLTGFLTRDAFVRPIFNEYLLGQTIGVLPLILGSLLTSFLSMENKSKIATLASLIYIVVNLALNLLFVKVLKLEAFGLALASSLGMWVYMAVEAGYFISGKSYLKLRMKQMDWHECKNILKTGLPGAAASGYQTARGLILNWLIGATVGSVGISALAAANNLLSVFWAIPTGMLAVSRMLISVSVGEEDRQTLKDIMRTALRKYIPLMCAVSAAIILCSVPLTRLYYRDTSQTVYSMTLRGLRILPLCMPLAIICTHFMCYGQASDKQGLVHTLSVLDGVICVAGFSALLLPLFGITGVYIANVINGLVQPAVILIYSWIRNRHRPHTLDELMVIPEDFGARESERIDISVHSMEEVVSISVQVQMFCLSRGIDKRRAYFSGLALEEMAGNIVIHGFSHDHKHHSIDVRIVHKDDTMILRIRDDCAPFDPAERQRMAEQDDTAKNIGLRMVFKMAREIEYQNIFGLNVLTIKI